MLRKKPALLLIALITSYATLAQDRVYLDKNRNITTKDSAVYYQQREKLNEEEAQVNTFYSNGTLKESQKFKNKSANGEYKSFYANGKPEEQGFYKEGRRKGIWNYYYQSGQKREVVEYADTEDATSNEPIMMQFWDSTGLQHIQEGTGNYFIFDDKGQKIEEGSYEKGVKVGKWIGGYNEYQFTENYQNGKLLNGVSQDKNGNKYEYTELEEMPEYIGGGQAIYRFLSKNVKYPKEAKRKRVQGTVKISFVINKEGKVENVSIIEGIGQGCDEEAVRAVSSMPQWKPGRQKGLPVVVKYAMPVFFRLEF
jgi:TonB family protein